MARKTKDVPGETVIVKDTTMSETIENDANGNESATRKRQITYEWDGESRVLTQFRDKKPVQTFAWSELNADIADRLAVHGLRQKLADSHAGKTADAETLTAEVWSNLVKGDWYAERAGGGDRSMFVEAYVRVMNAKGNPITVEAFRKIVNDIESGDDDDKKKTLRGVRANADIVRMENTIREERAAARRGTAEVSLEAVL